MSTKKSDFNIPESQDKSKNKTKKTPATLDDVVKAVDKVSKNISDIPSDIKSTITKNNKDQEQITNGKLKTITDKISEQNKNIQNLIKEINKIKSSGTSSSKGTSTNKNDNTKSSNFKDLSKEEQQRLNREQEYQKKLDAHEKKVAEIAKINAQTTQIQEATAKSYELFLTQNKKALDDLVFFNKKSDLEISKKTEELKYISEKNAKSLLEMEAESQRKNDKHNAWKEDREYFFGKTNKKAKNNDKSTGFMKSVKDFFTLNDKNTDIKTNASNDNNTDKTSKLSTSDIIKVEVVKLPIESLSALNVSNSQNVSNDNKDNSFTSIAKNFQDRLSEIENKILEGAKSNNKDNQKLILTQAKINKQLQDNTATRIKAETDNSIKLAKESREKQKFEIDTKLKQQTLEQNKRKFDIDEQDKLFKMARDLEKHTAWQEDRAYDLEKRKKADKEAYKDSYKESRTYRAIDSVKNAHSGFGTSVAMSALTGGFVNPAIINALKLDKLMMAPLEAFGKSLLRSKKKESGNYTTTSAIKNSKNVDIIREMHVLGGKLDKIAEPKEIGTKEKKSKGIFEKLGDLFGSLGGLAKGLGMAGIAMLIKYLFPKTMKALNDKFMGFLTDTVGLSEGTAQGINQLLKDALPGAIAGFTIGGFKGALIGAGLSIGYNYIKRKWDEWHGNSENEGQTPSSIGPIPLRYAQAGIAGAAVGGLFGFKGMAIGLLTGIAGQGLWDLGKKLGEWAAAAVNWFSEHPMSTIGLSLLGLSNIGNIKRAISGVSTALKAAKGAIKDYSKRILDAGINIGKASWNFTKNIAGIAFDKVKGGIIRLGGALGNAATTVTRGIASNVTSVLPNVKSGLLKMVKAAGWVGAALLAFDIGKMLGEKITEYVQSKDHAKTQNFVNNKNEQFKRMSGEEHGHYIQYLQETGQYTAYNQDKDFDFSKSEKDFQAAREKNPEKYGKDAVIINHILNTEITPEEANEIHKEKLDDLDYNSEENPNKNKAEEQAKGIAEKTNNIKDGPENDAPANTNNTNDINNINLNTEGSEKVNKYNDVPWNYNLFARNNIIPSKVASNLNSFHEDVISPLQRELGNNKIQITSSYRSPSYNASVGGARNSNHMRGNAIDLVVNGMSPTQVVNKLNEKEIPFDRALIEHLNGKQWLHLEYAANHSHPGIIAKMDAGGYKVVSNGNGEKQFLPEIVGGNEGEDLGISNIANVFSSGINDFYNLLSFMAGGEGYRSSTVNMTSSSSSASSMSSNASKDVQKLDTATIPSTEMANTNELAQLNNSISGNGNSGSDSLANIMTNVAENTANANQNNSAPIIYNNTTTQSSDNDDSVYPVGDLAKTLLYA